MPAATEDAQIRISGRWLLRVLSGIVVLLLPFDGSARLLPFSLVTETIAPDRLWFERFAFACPGIHAHGLHIPLYDFASMDRRGHAVARLSRRCVSSRIVLTIH